MKPYLFLLYILFWGYGLSAQISGTIKGLEDGKEVPLTGANIFWQGTNIGAVADENGSFTIEKPTGASKLTASFIGYQSQTKIIISRKGETHFILSPAGEELDAATVVGKIDATSIDLRRPDLTYKIDDKELRKAACCNLSESFETNATVDVSFTDAVTGTKHIEMLGLAGRYALIQRENIPFGRGLNAATGFTYIPGPFVESIQLTKGLSSVINGYESITGQINVELYKPETAPILLFNAFSNQGGRMEGNIVSSFDAGEKLSSAILLHYSNTPFINDNNNDGFADIPTGSQFNLTNRWHYRNEKSGWEGQFGGTVIRDLKNGGQVDFLNEQNPADSLWGYTSEGNRYELFGKTGYVFKNSAFRSLGIIYNANYHTREAKFGQRLYNGEQKGLYFNTIYQDILGSSFHKFRTGISFQADDISEDLLNNTASLYAHNRVEMVPGAYFEYTYEPTEKMTFVGGLRGDYNSYFNKTYVTPRLNVRYAPFKETTLRIGGGRGQRTPNVVIEHLHALASNRSLFLDRVKDLEAEIAWNSGASISQKFKLFGKDIDFNGDIFYTWFDNKLVKDSDFEPTASHFLFQQGSSSLSILGQFDFELIKNLNLRLAYKYLDSKDQYLEGLNQTYLVPKHRTFLNLGYSLASLWKFDATLNWFDQKRLPNTSKHPTEFQLPLYSDDFFLLHLQVNKEFKSGLELFVGVDNLLDFRQSNPIISVDDPNSPYFDTNFAWGPIFGRNIYIGLYYRLDKKS